MATTNVMILASRFYSSLAKHQLAALRKKTGFPLGKCKEALTANNNDLEIAEKWLDSQAQAEGWAKVEKLRDRTANQGLIGLLIRGNRGAMVEVNFEVDVIGFIFVTCLFCRLIVKLILLLRTRNSSHWSPP